MSRLIFLTSCVVFNGYASAAPNSSVLDACNAPAQSTTLSAAKQSITDARAIWLDASTIQWPSTTLAVGESLALYTSPNGEIVAEKGQRMAGASRRVSLVPRTTALPDAMAERYKYLAAGTVVVLAHENRALIDTLLQEQVVVAKEDAAGRLLDVTMLQHPGALDDRYQRAQTLPDLGAVVDRHRTTFKLWAPTAQRVHLCRYDSALAPAKVAYKLRRETVTGVWQYELPQPSRKQRDVYYAYLVDVWVTGIGIVRNRVTDPYSQTLSADSKRSMAIAMNDPALLPKNWYAVTARHRVKHAVDMSIYELHVRDFSMNDTRVAESSRGKYMAFTESNSRGMQHLQKLSKAGLTDVHLLPVFDFATVPESGCVTPNIKVDPGESGASESPQAEIARVRDRDCYNWGYDPLHFNAPEGSYATDTNDDRVRVREFREMVQALNNIGLRVGMDVVYNHMSASGQREKSVLDRIVPGYYHRLNANGAVETSTCCDNTATEHRMMEKLMSDSVLHWAKHYKIDSFRFDLMGHQPRAAMERMQSRLKRELGRDIQLIGEGWNFGEVESGKRFVQASQLSLNHTGIGTFTDRLRDAVRGGGFGDNAEGLVRNQGYINGMNYDANEAAVAALTAATPVDAANTKQLMQTADMIRAGLAGSIRDYTLPTFDGSTKRLDEMQYHGAPVGYASEPSEVVNYVENHDNETLFDFNAYKMPLTATREDRARAQVLGIAITAFAQGIAYFHAGIDILRSKSMDRNSFDSGDWFNRIDWTYRDNGFASGLPRKDENGDKWSIIRARLVDPDIKPTQHEIEWTAAATRELLAIRASSSLFRMKTAADIQQRLRFFNVGPSQVPTVIAAELDGTHYEGANFKKIIYLINVDKIAHAVADPRFVGGRFELHPIQASAARSESSVASTSGFDAATGAFSVPARSVSVFVSR